MTIKSRALKSQNSTASLLFPALSRKCVRYIGIAFSLSSTWHWMRPPVLLSGIISLMKWHHHFYQCYCTISANVSAVGLGWNMRCLKVIKHWVCQYHFCFLPSTHIEHLLWLLVGSDIEQIKTTSLAVCLGFFNCIRKCNSAEEMLTQFLRLQVSLWCNMVLCFGKMAR